MSNTLCKQIKRLTADRCRSQRRRNAETPEQSAARRSSQRGYRRRQRQQLKSAVPLFEAALADVDSDHFKLSDTFSLHSCGTMSQKCEQCQARFFPDERLSSSSCRFGLCCGDGKVTLWPVPEPPESLANLLSCETAEQTAVRLTADRCRSQRRRNAETPEQSAARRSSQRDCRQRQRQ